MNIQNYQRQLFKNDNQTNHFILPWGQILMKNINAKGKLVEYKSLKELKKAGVPIWINCKLLLFRYNNEFHTFFQCHHCQVMKSVDSWTINQNPELLTGFKCLHSLMADRILRKSGTYQLVSAQGPLVSGFLNFNTSLESLLPQVPRSHATEPRHRHPSVTTISSQEYQATEPGADNFSFYSTLHKYNTRDSKQPPGCFSLLFA